MVSGQLNLVRFQQNAGPFRQSGGLTADRMLVLSRAGQAAGLTFNQTSESLSALVKAGVSGEAQIASISQSVARFSSASGVEGQGR
ncbi:phage tail length tape measure family protein [Escherichia coli]|uniref:phage tail length tape measure family protein n=1 Tax=Escherichia coli TaxID=562 RepID=UPI000E1B8A8E|nr:phage tail length tape measure family protein [Escherichia coli]